METKIASPGVDVAVSAALAVDDGAAVRSPVCSSEGVLVDTDGALSRVAVSLLQAIATSTMGRYRMKSFVGVLIPYV
jgi:hypothetical protein